ncbi:hypothetical protein KKH05_00105 [Patescibacteria group bacterium]|nr:hypothetical protein [Patescibacteria group bacterium]
MGIFFLDVSEKAEKERRIREAFKVCKGCSVKPECLVDLLTTPPSEDVKLELRAGTNHKLRRQLRVVPINKSEMEERYPEILINVGYTKSEIERVIELMLALKPKPLPIINPNGEVVNRRRLLKSPIEHQDSRMLLAKLSPSIHELARYAASERGITVSSWRTEAVEQLLASDISREEFIALAEEETKGEPWSVTTNTLVGDPITNLLLEEFAWEMKSSLTDIVRVACRWCLTIEEPQESA